MLGHTLSCTKHRRGVCGALLLWLLSLTSNIDGQVRRAPCIPARSTIMQLDPRPVTSTGNPVYDWQLNNAFFGLSQIYNVRAAVKLYQEDDEPNALASPTAINPYYPDGTVYLGMEMLRDEMDRYFSGQPRPFTYTIAAVLAHELGHIAQMRYLSSTVREGFSPVQLELGADFLAGWAFRRSMQMYPQMGDLGAVSDGMEIFYELGDETEFTSHSHGSPRARVDAFQQGLRANAFTPQFAIHAMQRYIRDNLSDSEEDSDPGAL